MKAREILVSLTSTRKDLIPLYLKEIRELKLTRLALFPTCLNQTERQALYRELEDSPVTDLPHVHLRSDMSEAELDYLTRRFRTRVFNIHSRHSDYPFHPESPKYNQQIFLENSGLIPRADELADFGGLCIDFSHWMDGILAQRPEYEGFTALIERFPPGCCHVSAIRTTGPKSPWGGFDFHVFEHVEELDYLVELKAYLPELVSLELENPPSQQLQAKTRLETLLGIN